jgi:hypothetical protein
MMKFGLSVLLLLLLRLQSPDVHEISDITVRLIFLDGGKPAGSQQIILYEGDPTKASTTPQIKQITGPDGVAKFHLAAPVPEKLWVYDDNGSITNCAWEDPLLLKDVLAVGATVGVDGRFGHSCKGNRDIVTRLGAKPGEIVIFVRKLTSWDNFRHY